MIPASLSPPPTIESAEGRAWFFDGPPAVVTQITGSAMRIAEAKFLGVTVHDAVVQRYFSGTRKILYVHDWRACASYEIAARSALLDWGRAGASMTAETVILFSSDASPFLRIALITGAVIMRQIGMKLTAVESAGTWLSRFAAETPVAPLR